MPRSTQLKNVGPKLDHTHIICPFCEKGVRTDNYPSHLKTEMKKKNVTNATEMLAKIETSEDGFKWSEVGSMNILIKNELTASNKPQYPVGVCFDCHRVIKNKPTTMSLTDCYDNHSCDYRKKGPDDTIELIIKSPIEETDETNRFLADVSKTFIKAVESYPLFKNSAEMKDELLAKLKSCKSDDKKEEVLSQYRATLSYLVPKVLKSSKTDNAWFESIYDTFPILFSEYEALPDIDIIKTRITEGLLSVRDIAQFKAQVVREMEARKIVEIRKDYQDNINALQDQIVNLKQQLKIAAMEVTALTRKTTTFVMPAFEIEKFDELPKQ